MNKKQLYESIMRTVSHEVKKALNEKMARPSFKDVYYEIECIPFDYDFGKYIYNQRFVNFVKVINIPFNFDSNKLISEEEKPEYLCPLCSYIADNFLIDGIDWKSDRTRVFVYKPDESFEDEWSLTNTLNFDEIMNYYNSLN
ncbi:MAG: hypothetical protein [Wendovervirus sonii]|uniref:Uncharacterized protein n=1 Tax=phage Lak_Megaphage_Sonny TaxID=3109229 RepID=A0ABZ0Z468_9CAUD|nr:MAG: hypothetical protein [phage Lak_Megaphage_Sonny]